MHDLVESSDGAADIVQSEEVGAAMLSLRAFMFERVYLGPARSRRARAGAGAVRRIFDHLVAQVATPTEIVDFVSGMTDRFALEYAARLPDGADQGHLGPRGRRRGRHGRGRLGAHALRKRRRALDRALPVPRGADAELLRQPGGQALLLLRLRQRAAT